MTTGLRVAYSQSNIGSSEIESKVPMRPRKYCIS